MTDFQEFVERFQEQIEVAKTFIDEANIEGIISGDTTTVMELIVEIADELESLITDEVDEEE